MIPLCELYLCPPWGEFLKTLWRSKVQRFGWTLRINMYRFSLISINKSLNMVREFWNHYVCKFCTSKNLLPMSCKGHKVVKIHRTFKINNYRFWNIFIETMPKIILAMLSCYVFKFWGLQTKEQKTWCFCSISLNFGSKCSSGVKKN